MKRELLSLLCVVTISLTAQNQLQWNGDLEASSKISTSIDEYSNLQLTKPNYKIATTSAIMGQGPNGFGCAFGPLKPVSAHEGLNSIAFIHRSDFNTNGDNTSGSLRYDISTDGGASWNNNVGPIYNPAVAAGQYPGPARYPNLVLFNPENATITNNAYLGLWTTTYLNQNNWYGGQLMGSYKLDNSATKINVDSCSPALGYPTISRAFWKATETTIFGANLNNNDASTYSDTIMIYKGVWDAANDSLVYTKSTAYLPLGNDANGNEVYADFKMAFDITGQKGYILVLGYSTSYPTYGVFHPIVIKTTDGGTTWSAPQNIDLDGLMETTSNQSLLQVYKDVDTAWTVVNLSNAFDADITVDKNGDPHILVNVCPAAVSSSPPGGTPGGEFSVFSGINGLVDIYSTDGGSTYKSMVVGFPQTFRGPFGTDPSNPDVNEDNRMHLSRSADGSKIFYSWFDTDPVTWGTTDNVFPDLWVNMYDVDNDSIPHGPQNMTMDISVTGISTFGNIAPEAWTNASEGTWTIHSVTQQLDPNSNDFYAPVQFTYMAAKYPLGNIQVLEFKGTNFFDISQTQPNPMQSVSNFSINTRLSGDFEIEVTNIMGQVVHQQSLKNLAPGQHEVVLDLTNLSSGTYLYAVSAKGMHITKKLIIQ